MKHYRVSYREMVMGKGSSVSEVYARIRNLTDDDILDIVDWNLSHLNTTDTDYAVYESYDHALSCAKTISYERDFALVQTQVGYQVESYVAFISEEDASADGDVEIISVTTVIAKTINKNRMALDCNFIVKRVNQK